MKNRIEVLKTKIENIQKEWRNNPNYDGCMFENVRGMIDAVNIFTEKTWKFDENGNLTDF